MSIETVFRPGLFRLTGKGLAFFLAAWVLLAGCAPVSPLHRPERAVVSAAGQAAAEKLVEGAKPLKVLLLSTTSQSLKLSAPGGLVLTNPASGEVLARLLAKSTQALGVKHGSFRLDGRSLETGRLGVRPLAEGDAVQVSGHTYRGTLTLVLEGGGRILLVNSVGLEEYLFGVLSSEVPPSWPPQALKAQAVAARTYALFRSQSAQGGEYDLDDTDQSQVYKGLQHEDARTRDAVKATAGEILTFEGSPAQTFFFSNCGGHTADAGLVWSKQVPYLRGVACGYCDHEKHASWETSLEFTQAARRLKAAGLIHGGLRGMVPENQDQSGRWVLVRLKTSGQDEMVKSSLFRSALGPDIIKSTHFEVIPSGQRLVFRGRGFGHGIGLCQEGAKGMAERGYNYLRILEHYYPGTRLERR